MKNFKKKRQAFSLIEISVVILIVGILISGISRGADLYNDYKLSIARKLTQESPVSRVPDLALWLESVSEKSLLNKDDSLKIKNNDLIKKWVDVNPRNQFGQFLEQNNVANMPTYVADGINNLPSVKFDSTNLVMRMVGSFSDIFSVESTIFIVFRAVSVCVSDMTLSQIFSFGTLNPVMVIESPYNSTQNTTYLYKNAQTDGIINNSIKLNTTQIYRRVYNPNINQSYVDINGDRKSCECNSNLWRIFWRIYNI
ncbi:MAG: type II secretion system protein [Proteobacteria bacterium]|nr:type II secretion system protein [Pseudomonadota bacterium]